MRVVAQPLAGTTGNLLTSALSSGNYNTVSFAVAFARVSGVRVLRRDMSAFVASGGHVKGVLGIDQDGTTYDALAALLEIVSTSGELWVNHDEAPSVIFHPKLYLFEGPGRGLLVIGSSNLTQQALTANDEAMFYGEIGEGDTELLESARAALAYWRDPATGTALRLTPELLERLRSSGYLPMEQELAERSRQPAASGATRREQLFGRRRRATTRRHRAEDRTPTTEAHNRVFVMTLMRTDVGVGQTTPGTSRRSPEIFIPLTARDAEPGFWGWPDRFTEDRAKPGKYDREQVKMRIGAETVPVNMMTWPDKHDFRLRSEALRSAGREGDLLRIEGTPADSEFEYYVEVIPRSSEEYDYYDSFCTNETPHSERRWGYF